MRILISSRHFLPLLGGSIQYATMLGRAFREQGHEVRFMTRTAGDAGPVEGCEVVRLPGAGEKWRLAGWAEVLLQVDASWGDVWPFLLRGVPWFPTVHSGRIPGPHPCRKRLSMEALALAFRLGRTIPVSRSSGLSWGVRAEPIDNPYDDQVFHLPPAAAERDIDLLFVGRVEASKGVFVLLEALERLAPAPRRRAAIVGDGVALDELKRRAAALADRWEFEFPGRLDAAGTADWMRRARVLAFPTTPAWIEASPLTPLEALACGCRIVASDNGGTRDNVGPDAILVPPGEVAPLADALERALGEPEPGRLAAREEFLRRRRLAPVADRYLDRFHAVLG